MEKEVEGEDGKAYDTVRAVDQISSSSRATRLPPQAVSGGATASKTRDLPLRLRAPALFADATKGAPR